MKVDIRIKNSLEKKIMANSRKEKIIELLDEIRNFRMCGPSDDPDEITSVTSRFRYLTIQLQRLTAILLPERLNKILVDIDVEINNIYSAYDAKAEIDALSFDIEQILETIDSDSLEPSNNKLIHHSLIEKIQNLENKNYDFTVLSEICREINSSFMHGNLIATALLLRTLLNYIPPIFGHKTFAQVAANIGKSLKDSFEHLEEGLRKVADYHTHRTIGEKDIYPTNSQIEPFKPQIELLLQQVIVQADKSE